MQKVCDFFIEFYFRTSYFREQKNVSVWKSSLVSFFQRYREGSMRIKKSITSDATWTQQENSNDMCIYITDAFPRLVVSSARLFEFRLSAGVRRIST